MLKAIAIFGLLITSLTAQAQPERSKEEILSLLKMNAKNMTAMAHNSQWSPAQNAIDQISEDGVIGNAYCMQTDERVETCFLFRINRNKGLVADMGFTFNIINGVPGKSLLIFTN